MDESEPLPVIEQTNPPVLSYANLRGEQPADSRFVCEHTAAGVRLTEPPRLGEGRIMRMIGVALIGASLAVSALAVVKMRTEHDWQWGVVTIPLLIIAGALASLRQSRLLRTEPIQFEVRAGELFVSTQRLFFRQRRWKVTAFLKAASPSRGVTFVSLRRPIERVGVVVVQARPWLGLHTTILNPRPQAECDWIARELNAAIERSLAIKEAPDLHPRLRENASDA